MPSMTGTLGGSASARYLLFLAVALCIVSTAIGVAFWAAIKYDNTKFLVVILAFQIVASQIVGALAATMHVCLGSRALDSERGDSATLSTRSGSPAPPSEPHIPRDETDRNFSLPRERCLDPPAPLTSRLPPVPPCHIATGLASKIQAQQSPPSTPPPTVTGTRPIVLRSPMVADLIVQPLDLHKINRRKSEILLKPTVKDAGPERSAVGLGLAAEPGSGISFFPALPIDKQEPVIVTDSSLSNPSHDTGTIPAGELADLLIEDFIACTAGSSIPESPDRPATWAEVDLEARSRSTITDCSLHEAEEHASSSTVGAAFSTTEEILAGSAADIALPSAEAVLKPTLPGIPQHLLASASQVQRPASTSPPATQDHSLSPTKLSTIRLVDSFLEPPQKRDHASLGRKWKGQQSFISF